MNGNRSETQNPSLRIVNTVRQKAIGADYPGASASAASAGFHQPRGNLAMSQKPLHAIDGSPSALADLLSDPVIQAVMQADGVTAEQVIAVIERVISRGSAYGNFGTTWPPPRGPEPYSAPGLQAKHGTTFGGLERF